MVQKPLSIDEYFYEEWMTIDLTQYLRNNLILFADKIII